MLCAISGGNWNNGSNAGVWAFNSNNARSNSNNKYGFRSDPLPAKPPCAALAEWQRGGPRRAWWRNQVLNHPLVALAARVGSRAKIGAESCVESRAL
jgi:hypothetical protein